MKPLLVALLALGCLALETIGQEPVGSVRMVEAQGLATRVMTMGLEDRGPGEPVVLLMTGASYAIENWGYWISSVSSLGPVAVYDRPGAGESEWDGRELTPEVVLDHAEAVLEAAGVEGPYVLVGHSWGATLAMYFAERRAEDVVGMVYLDPGNPTQSPLEFYAAADEAELARHVEEYRELARTYGDLPPALVEEQLQIANFYEKPLAERRLPDNMGIPSALVVAGYVGSDLGLGPDLPRWIDGGYFNRLKRGTMQFALDRTFERPHSTIIYASESEHDVFLDVPDLSLMAVRRVMDAVAARR